MRGAEAFSCGSPKKIYLTACSPTIPSNDFPRRPLALFAHLPILISFFNSNHGVDTNQLVRPLQHSSSCKTFTHPPSHNAWSLIVQPHRCLKLPLPSPTQRSRPSCNKKSSDNGNLSSSLPRRTSLPGLSLTPWVHPCQTNTRKDTPELAIMVETNLLMQSS